VSVRTRDSRWAFLVAIVLCLPSSLVAQGRVLTIHLFSPALGVPKSLTVYLPAAYDTSSSRFPTAYYLHGAGGDERSWVRRLALDSVADSLARAGLPPAILIMPDGDTGYWTNWARVDGGRGLCSTDSIRLQTQETTDTYCVRYGRYESYLVHDVLGFVDSAYRTLRDPRHRGIGGFSMGGYGAVSIAARHPSLFGAAVSHSGVLALLYVGPHPYPGHATFAATVAQLLPRWPAYRWPLFEVEFGTDTAQWWARDPMRQLARLRSAGRSLPRLYIDVGVEDTLTVDQNRAFHDALAKQHIAHTYQEFPGAHTTAYWRAHEAEGLAWLLQQIRQ
jgi:S-formylglutathione hydrolase FrmB